MFELTRMVHMTRGGCSSGMAFDGVLLEDCSIGRILNLEFPSNSRIWPMCMSIVPIS